MPQLRPALSKFSQTLLSICTLSLLASTSQAQTPAQLSDCDNAGFQRTIRSANYRAANADAVWLDAQSLHWSGQAEVQAGQQFYLYVSASAQLQVKQGKVVGAERVIPLSVQHPQATAAAHPAFRYLPAGLQLQQPLPSAELRDILKNQLVIVRSDAQGQVIATSHLQTAAALDQLYASASQQQLGVAPQPGQTSFKLWAPTAQAVYLCIYKNPQSRASRLQRLEPDHNTGIWQITLPQNLSQQYYRYLLDVYVPGQGLVRNRVTDPYAISLSADSRHSYIADLNDPALKPDGWDQHSRPAAAVKATAQSFYELHVRDFSIQDQSVPAAQRGKFLAFTQTQSAGMQHLRELAAAGLTDLHLLPVFDFATVPERHCLQAKLNSQGASAGAQAWLRRHAAKDCYNWGYDPWHYNAPEGSYASQPDDGAVRIREMRQMVMALHQLGLRVGMDVVYNHTAFSGQHPQAVLDRIVPGYYQRLNAQGKVEDSTCQPCGNTATEHMMMAKLMQDSVRLWARHYQIDSFRFDLMGHQPRAVMEQLREQLQADNQRPIYLIGEGWNFGEVANNQRFVQASQLSLAGSQIATFNDRLRDALRGGGHGDNAASMSKNQGYINGMLERHDLPLAEKQRVADLVRLGLAGSVAEVRLQNASGVTQKLADFRYGDQAAGYVSSAAEVVNYAENHDNATLYDLNLYRLPADSSASTRVHAQVLALGFSILAQGIPYLHAGSEILRSKSLDHNSYNSGDWFNAIDWRYHSNGFARGLPAISQQREYYPVMRPLLQNPALIANQAMILQSKASVLDLLRLRYSSPLFQLSSASEIQQRLRFHNTGPLQNPALIVLELDGSDLPESRYRKIVVLFNSANSPQQITLPALQQLALQLHPVHLQAKAGDPRIANETRYDAANGSFSLPALSISCFVVEQAH